MAKEYDVVILGAGPAGYVAAVRAEQLGFKVALVEQDRVGGVCLHRGCIPTKTLLESAKVYHYHQKGSLYGVDSSAVSLNMPVILERKRTIVEKLHKGLQSLLNRPNITMYRGKGRILGPSIFSPRAGVVSVEYSSGEESELLIPRFVLVATGSRPGELVGFEKDGQSVIDSDSALDLSELPKSVLIIGGGVIGIEWASMWSDFGVEVTILEQAPRILMGEDADISQAMTKNLTQRGVRIITSATLVPETVQIGHNSITVSLASGESLKAEKVFLATGRVANIEDIGLANTTIKLERNAIVVNQFMQTAESHIYAVGDVIGGYQLAHAASSEAVLAIEHMAGNNPTPISKMRIPRAIYSRPEVGSIGLSEAEAKDEGYEVHVGRFPLAAVAKALIIGESDGFVKVIADATTDNLLGIHIIGPQATELISEASLAMLLEATPWELSHSIRPHPTLVESLTEAALALQGAAIHN